MHSVEFEQARTWRATANHIWSHQGLKGFYKGLAPSAMRALFACGVMFATVDMVRIYLSDLLNTNNPTSMLPPSPVLLSCSTPQQSQLKTKLT